VNFSQKRKILEIIGLYEIIGGGIGLGLILYGVIELNKITIISVLFWIIVVVFYSFTIYAGAKLYKNHEKGIIFSEIIQYFQVVSFGMFGYFLTLSAGITLYFGIDYTNNFTFKFLFNLLPSNSEIAYLSDQTTFYFYINLIPILIIFFFYGIQESIENK